MQSKRSCVRVHASTAASSASWCWSRVSSVAKRGSSSHAPCSATLGGAGPSAAIGWWQQEYLTDIGGAAKPSWVGWDTTNTPADALVLPLAWNQRPKAWVAAPDYNTAQDGTWSKACAGCHEVGLTLAVDATGFVTRYARASADLGCEKCHGPGSVHVGGGGDAGLIVNPRYLTAQAEREVCGQCHSQGVSSASPAGALGYAWNDQATVGGGNFIPGVHQQPSACDSHCLRSGCSAARRAS